MWGAVSWYKPLKRRQVRLFLQPWSRVGTWHENAGDFSERCRLRLKAVSTIALYWHGVRIYNDAETLVDRVTSTISAILSWWAWHFQYWNNIKATVYGNLLSQFASFQCSCADILLSSFPYRRAGCQARHRAMSITSSLCLDIWLVPSSIAE